MQIGAEGKDPDQRWRIEACLSQSLLPQVRSVADYFERLSWIESAHLLEVLEELFDTQLSKPVSRRWRWRKVDFAASPKWPVVTLDAASEFEDPAAKLSGGIVIVDGRYWGTNPKLEVLGDAVAVGVASSGGRIVTSDRRIRGTVG